MACDKSPSHDDQARPPLSYNPLLVKYFSPCFFEIHQKAYFRQANSFMTMPWTPNPRKEELDENGVMWSLPIEPPEDPYVQPFRKRFSREGASWRRILVAQPPIFRLGFLWNEERDEGARLGARFPEYVVTTRGIIAPLPEDSSTTSGLRMGYLYDLIQERACRHQQNVLWFRVHWDTILEPAYTKQTALFGERLMTRSRVVVEILERISRRSVSQPSNPEVFEDVSQSLEHKTVRIEAIGYDFGRKFRSSDRPSDGLLSKRDGVQEKRYFIF